MRVWKPVINSVFYLYSSEQAAIEGREEGGCGFLVSVPYAESMLHIGEHQYAVTADHVIRDNHCPVIRLNTVDGKVDTIPLALNQWKPHIDGCDLAVADLDHLPNGFQHRTLQSDILLTKQMMAMLDIGLGDDVYMVGRFVHHEGKKRNRPSARSGIVSVMPDANDLIDWSPYPAQEAFLIEMRSVSGYSGSPVCFDLPLTPQYWNLTREMMGFEPDEEGRYRIGPYVIGIDIGAFSYYNKLYAVRKEKQRTITTEVDGYEVKSHAGQSVVVPAWKLLEMLDMEEFVMARKERFRQRVPESVARRVTEKHATTQQEKEITRSEFEKALRKASQKVSEPESKDSQTSE